MMGEYLQGSKTDRELFEAVGRVALDAEVHKLLGNAVSSADGDWWFVSIRPSGVADAFAVLRVSNTSAHIRYAYSTNASLRSAVVKRAIAKARELGSPVIFTNERKSDDLWPSLGFELKPTKRRGDFVRWEMTLGEKAK